MASAGRTASRVVRCLSRVFMLDLNRKTSPFYFSLSSKPRDGTGDEPHALSGLCGTNVRLYSVHVECVCRIERARRHAELQRDLAEDFDVFELLSFLPGVQDSVEKGFLLRDGSSSSGSELVLKQLQRTGSVSLFCYNREDGGVIWWREIWTPDGQQGAGKERCYILPVAEPNLHPSALSIRNSDVFYRMEDAYKVLEECSDIIPESKEVLELVDQELEVSKPGKQFPVIVIEGLDATGKTTLTESLQKALGAALLKSPPQCLSPFRQRFDSEPPLIRRAFYALGNYITAAQIARVAAKTPVIVDRYWHSTAAYAIATAVGGMLENLPASGSDIYEWPADLLKPSLVLLLTVSPQERLRRLQHRGLEKTVEEMHLEINQLFREKVDEAYKHMRSPACVVVDASPEADQVLQQVLRLIKSECCL